MLTSAASPKNGQTTENYDTYFTSPAPAAPVDNSYAAQDNFVPNKKMHDEFDWRLMQVCFGNNININEYIEFVVLILMKHGNPHSI